MSVNKNLVKLTRTAVMLALLICLQWVGSMIPEPLTKQLITGSMVNCVLAVTALWVGLGGGLTVALISPVCAFILGIAPQIITVLPIMAGNAVYVLLLGLLAARASAWKQYASLALAAVSKFAVLYVLVVKLICDLFAPELLGQKVGEYVLLGPKMLLPKALPLMFSWPQLITALIGGTLALLISPVLRKALKK